MADPGAELKRITRRIADLQTKLAELHEQQRVLISRSAGVSSEEESVILDALALAAEVQAFLDRVDVDRVEGVATTTQRRKAITYSRRLDRVTSKLERLPDSDGKGAASQAVSDSVQRLLKEMFGA